MKPVWTCIHRDGYKFYHYGKGDWINAQNGEKVAPDLTGVETPPSDATHVQVVNGKVRHIKLFADNFVSVWSSGEWTSGCTLGKLPGTVVRLVDGVVRRPDWAWVSFKGDNPPAQGSIVDVEWFDGDTDFGRPANGYVWSPCNKIKRWRYA